MIKNILLIYIFILTFKINGQTAKDFLVNDSEKIFKKNITTIISDGNNAGYSLNRNDKNEFIFTDGMHDIVILKKTIDTPYSEGFPDNSIGWIFKKFYFSGSDINKKICIKIESEIILNKYSNVNAMQIKNYFNNLKKDITSNITKNKYEFFKSENLLNFKSLTGQFYDICLEQTFNKKCKDSQDFCEGIIFSSGESYNFDKSNNQEDYYFSFTVKNKEMSELFDMITKTSSKSSKSMENSINNIRFVINGVDMRKINEYDLESMIQFFLKDCNRNNIKLKDQNSIIATFEPLEGNTIALAYGFGNDSLIKIKVDPEKWMQASIEKKWYVIYHELGHDVLNLEHGQAGKMMFNFADKEYTWDEFFMDKEYMFNNLKR